MKLCSLLITAALFATPAIAPAREAPTPDFAVGAQYDSTHVYVAPADFDRFVASFIATLRTEGFVNYVIAKLLGICRNSCRSTA